MNELEKQLAKVIEKAIQVAEETGQFVIDQAPDLLQEFYKWHIAKSILMITIFIGVIWVFYLISLKSYVYFLFIFNSFFTYFSIKNFYK